MFKYICRRCSIGLSKQDISFNKRYSFGHLLCFDCLCKIGDFKLPENLSQSKLYKLLGGTDIEFEESQRKLEKRFSNLERRRSKYEYH
jgi:hypothetical protein